MRDPPPAIRPDGGRGPASRAIARATERAPRTFIAGAAILTAVGAAGRRPAFLRDPWEYDFDRLGSRGQQAAAGRGSGRTRPTKVFGGKMNVAGALMLADTPEQVPLLKEQILENDEADPQGRLIADVATVVRSPAGNGRGAGARSSRCSTASASASRRPCSRRSPTDERARVEELKPPEGLRVLGPRTCRRSCDDASRRTTAASARCST